MIMKFVTYLSLVMVFAGVTACVADEQIATPTEQPVPAAAPAEQQDENAASTNEREFEELLKELEQAPQE